VRRLRRLGATLLRQSGLVSSCSSSCSGRTDDLFWSSVLVSRKSMVCAQTVWPALTRPDRLTADQTVRDTRTDDQNRSSVLQEQDDVIPEQIQDQTERLVLYQVRAQTRIRGACMTHRGFGRAAAGTLERGRRRGAGQSSPAGDGRGGQPPAGIPSNSVGWGDTAEGRERRRLWKNISISCGVACGAARLAEADLGDRQGVRQLPLLQFARQEAAKRIAPIRRISWSGFSSSHARHPS
jgi:hypothetical protein